MSAISDTSYPTGGGYTCAICHFFVPNGVTHFCAGYQASPPMAVKWDRMSDVRIADALERIAAALEGLTRSEDRSCGRSDFPKESAVSPSEQKEGTE